MLRRLALRLFAFCLLLISYRKLYKAYSALSFIESCYKSVSEDLIFASLAKTGLVEKGQVPVVLFQNKHILDLSHNWLCNTKDMADLHERVIFVTLDSVAKNTLNRDWPQIKQFYWPTTCLKEVFHWGSGEYQIFMILRSNLAAAFAKLGVDVWFVQQDTIWRGSDFIKKYENTKADIIFDQNGFESSARVGWINGGNLFVRGTPISERFFQWSSKFLRNFYTADVAVWMRGCAEQVAHCHYFDFDVISSWEWLYYGNRFKPPYLLGMDAEGSLSKFANMRKYGFHFTNEDRSCNSSAVKLASENLAKGTVSVPLGSESWERYNFGFFLALQEFLVQIPFVGENLVKPYVPLFGYFLMITA